MKKAIAFAGCVFGVLMAAGTGETVLWPSDKTELRAPSDSSIAPLPDGLPVVVAGGSFNHRDHSTRMREEDRQLIDRLLETLDPEQVYFVVGHTLTGQEGYLAERNRGRFRIAAIVPNRITTAEKNRLLKAG